MYLLQIKNEDEATFGQMVRYPFVNAIKTVILKSL